MMRTICLLIGMGLSFLAGAKPPSKIKFIENKNQWSTDTDFLSRIPGGAMHIKGGTFSYVLIDKMETEEAHHFRHTNAALSEVEDRKMVRGVRIDVDFPGSNPLVKAVGIGQSKEYYNYFLGSDSSRWGVGAFAYDGLYFKSLFDGIDMKLYTAGQNLKYDFVVKPGSDPSLIRVNYSGNDELLLLSSGDLLVKTLLGDITEKKPVAYQLIDGKRQTIACRFHLRDGEISFEFPEGYDACHELVIDPLLIFSTYSGSQADNWGSTATPGEGGTLYSSGITNHFVGQQLSGTFPATAGAFQTTYGGLYDVAILKYDSLGKTLLYASYLGGAGVETSHSLFVNSQNELLVLGSTGSSDFPTTTGAYDRTFNGGGSVYTILPFDDGTDIFVTRVSADGRTLLGSTYIGGSGNDGINSPSSPLRKNYGDDHRGDIQADEQGNIYISSVTESLDIPALNSYAGGMSDALIVKLPPGMTSVAWARYIGGAEADAAHSLRFGINQNLFTAGGSTSSNLPVASTAFQNSLAGDVDGWVAEITLDGALTTATYTGTSEFDQAYFVAVNKAGEVYLYGQTAGDRPIDPPDVYHNLNSGQFLQKLDGTLSHQLFYTVFGSGIGHPDISPTAFMVNDCNNLFMTGWGGALNTDWLGDQGFELATIGLPVTEDAYQESSMGHDFYLLVLSEDAKEILYGTYLGNISRTHVDGGTSRFDEKGIVYHAVCGGCGSGADDFPTTPEVVSRTNNSLNCNNAAFKFDLSSLRATFGIKGGSANVCIPRTTVFTNASVGGERFVWDFGDGSPLVTADQPNTVAHQYTTPGTYTVWLKAIDDATCQKADSMSLKIEVGLSEAGFPDDAKMCEEGSHTFTASGGAAYEWKSKDGLYSANSPSITVSPKESTWFYLDVVEAAGCVSSDSVYLEVVPKLNPDFSFERQANCSGDNKLFVRNLTDSLVAGDQVFFDFGDGTTSDLEELEHVFSTTGYFNVKLVGVRESCISVKEVRLPFGPLKVPNVITPALDDGMNDAFVVQYGEEPGVVPGDFGLHTQAQIYDRWGRLVYENNDYQNDWSASGEVGGVYYYEVKVQDHATCKGWLHVIK